MTSLLKIGEENLLEVTVDKHSADESINRAERQGDYWMFGGIFRPVWLEAVPAQGAAEAQDVVREQAELPEEEEPAPPAVGRGPDVREAGDGAGVHLRARLAEELRGRAGRAVDVRLELRRVELADQVREAGRSAAELAAVVDVEDGRARTVGHEVELW